MARCGGTITCPSIRPGTTMCGPPGMPCTSGSCSIAGARTCAGSPATTCSTSPSSNPRNRPTCPPPRGREAAHRRHLHPGPVARRRHPSTTDTAPPVWDPDTGDVETAGAATGGFVGPITRDPLLTWEQALDRLDHIDPEAVVDTTRPRHGVRIPRPPQLPERARHQRECALASGRTPTDDPRRPNAQGRARPQFPSPACARRGEPLLSGLRDLAPNRPD